MSLGGGGTDRVSHPSQKVRAPASKMTTLVAETAENPLAVDTEAPVAPAQAQTVADADTDSDKNALPPAAGEPPHDAQMDGVMGAARAAGKLKAKVTAAHAPDQLESNLQSHLQAMDAAYAEMDQAVEATRDTESGHGRRCKALLEDMNAAVERLTEKFGRLAADKDNSAVQLSFGGAKRKLRIGWANLTETGIELWNEVSDVVMIRKLFVEDFRKLFLVAAFAMALNVAARIALAARQRKEIDEGKRGAYLLGSAVYLVEPNLGQRLMKAALKDKAEGGLVFVSGEGYVHADKDAAAVKARNDYTAGKTQVRTTALMLGTEDMPELSIQMAYLWLAASEDLDLTFALTAAGTLAHLAQQGYEAWSVHRRLPEELRIAEGRDKTFDKTDGTKDFLGNPTMTTTDADVEEFAVEYHEVTRVVSLAECRLITDAAVQSLAKYCLNLRSLNLWGCSKVTNAGLQAVAKGCPQITSLNLAGCSEVTDVGLQAVAKGCAQITSLDLFGCDKVTDVGLQAVAKGCPQITSLNLTACFKVTDVGVQAVAKGCAQITSLHLYDCDKVTEAGKASLRAALPNCEIGG
eukprot:COSAG06_NODE_3419_length_5371_cov_12.650640_2_plen_578_part_00